MREQLLYLAAAKGNLNQCKLVVEEYNISINSKEDDDWTPLHSASVSGSIDVFEYLVENGGEVDSKLNDNRTCLHIAASKEHLNLCKLLIEKYNIAIHSKDYGGATSLHSASSSGSIDVFEYLVENGGEVDSRLNDHRICLHIAALKGHLHLCKLLIEKYKIDINSKDYGGATSLHIASFSGSIDVFEYLVENGGEVDSKLNYYRTCLYIAASEGHLNLCKLLI